MFQCPRCKTRFRGELANCPIDREPLVRMQDPLLGRTIAGRYVIEDRVGGGGMGTVYRARHQVIDRPVAIKFLHQRFTSDATWRKRFLGEARAANQIDHENIIDVTDFGETEDRLVYLVMEYLQGRSLDGELAGKPLEPLRALRIALQVASGLARAHELDVIHRDVKPGNIFLLRKRGGPDFVKLLDFGIARFEREVRITDRGSLMGTPEYMAPEQARSGEASAATDLYALGCVLFEMLTGRPPFTGALAEVLIKHMREPAPPPSKHAPDITPEVDAVVLKLLLKDPSRRHRDAFHLVDDLQALIGRPSLVPNGDVNEPAPTRRASSDSNERVSAVSGRTSATLHLPSEQEDWQLRLSQYRNQLAQAHPSGEPPEDIRAALANMNAALQSIDALRTRMDSGARELTQHEDELRHSRLRIGRALDELVRDESKVARALADEQEQHVATEAQLLGAVRSLTSHASGQAWSAATQSVDAARWQRLAMLLHELATADTVLERVRNNLEQKRTAWDDLRFQIAQLKGRLATQNADTNGAVVQAQEHMQRIESELTVAQEQLVSSAERVALYLRSRSEQANTMPSQ